MSAVMTDLLLAQAVQKSTAEVCIWALEVCSLCLDKAQGPADSAPLQSSWRSNSTASRDLAWQRAPPHAPAWPLFPARASAQAPGGPQEDRGLWLQLSPLGHSTHL